jgi:class 3 adenylate cyclase
MKLSSQRQTIKDLINSLNGMVGQDVIEAKLQETFKDAPLEIEPDNGDYYCQLNYHLYNNIVKMYRDGESHVCLWRFYKKLSSDQLKTEGQNESLSMLDSLVRVYFFSEPLDDLTCIFIPINDSDQVDDYLQWIKSYFYNENYPTSLLWLYALDSSMSNFFPDEIIYIGKRKESTEKNIMIPDFDWENATLIKRYTGDDGHHHIIEGPEANKEFNQIFKFLKTEYEDRCLSHSAKQDYTVDPKEVKEEWGKFEEVLLYGVSDKSESGCISFSDLRNSTEFLNRYGKNVFRNKIQQPFFERTKLISSFYNGRIDKFMGDNVMCVFLARESEIDNRDISDKDAILNDFFAIFDLCKVLLELLKDEKLEDSHLGLRSGVSYGKEILRSNLGNELVRDFTVTGETVNLAARLEHFSFNELSIHNAEYFEECIDRIPDIERMVLMVDDKNQFNPETRRIIREYTKYQNIVTNLETLSKARFDIRFNDDFYQELKAHFIESGYTLKNPATADIYGFEHFEIEGFDFYFYFSFYNPKGFMKYEKIWIVPLSLDVLENLDVTKIR